MLGPFNVVAIIAAYNEADIIGQVVRALIAEGVSVYLIDNRSTDRTVAEVEPFLGSGVIGIERFPDDSGTRPGDVTEFAWERLLKRKETLASELNADWFIHHDADEFRESPWSGLTLAEAIRQVDAAGFNAIDFHLLNFRPTEETVRSRGDVRDAIRFCEPGGAWDRVQIKCWKKTGDSVDLVSSGGHDVQFHDRRVFPIRFLLRHYPIRSQAHGERKLFRERLGRFVPEELARGWHVQYNDVREGTTFLRDRSSLTLYNPDAVRMDLVLRHREVERLEQMVATNQEAHAQRADKLVRLQQHVDAQNGELDALRPRVGLQESQLEELRRHLRAQDAELEQLRPCVGAQEAQLEEYRGHLRVQDGELERLRSCVGAQEAQLEELRRHLQAQDTELEGLRPSVGAQEAQLDEVRRHLQVQDGELERLRSCVGAQEAQLSELRRHLQAQDAELERLRPCVGNQEAQLDEVRAHLRAQDAELEQLRPCVGNQEAQLTELRRYLQLQDAELERLRPCVGNQEAQLAELRRHLQAQDAELEQLRPCVRAQETQLEELRVHLQMQDTELAQLRTMVSTQDGQRRELRFQLGTQDLIAGRIPTEKSRL